LSIAIDSQDKKTIENIQEETQKINKKLTLLKNQRENLKSEVTRLDNNILLENQENIDYLYEIDKYSPRAPIY
jgi:predicted RNase H-like nuclease (RuvC/YqgF family)